MTFLLKKKASKQEIIWVSVDLPLLVGGAYADRCQLDTGTLWPIGQRSWEKKNEMEQRCVSNRPSEHHGGLQRASTPCCSFSISKQQYYTLFLSNTNTFIFNIYFRVYSGIQDKNLSVIFLYSKDRNDKNCSLSRAKVKLSYDTNHLYLLKIILFSVR